MLTDERLKEMRDALKVYEVHGTTFYGNTLHAVSCPGLRDDVNELLGEIDRLKKLMADLGSVARDE